MQRTSHLVRSQLQLDVVACAVDGADVAMSWSNYFRQQVNTVKIWGEKESLELRFIAIAELDEVR